MGFPVEAKLAEIRAALARNDGVVLTAPPGSGKTTCVPPALLDEPWLKGKKIVMLEPRRLAARSCAEYIAAQRGERAGETVGYSVRLERKVSAKTRLEIVTEGLLTQRLLQDPELNDVGLVIFDEFHERSLACDVAFALALEVKGALRSDLRIVVMSATLDAEEVAAHLRSVVNAVTVVRAEGRMYPVATQYLGDVSMTAAIAKAMSKTTGDILCFLPGEGEIRRTASALEASSFSAHIAICALYGSLPKAEQDRVFERTTRRKVILATSIAETSLTIPGVTCVIDTGLMRVPRFSPATGMSGLVTLPLTRDRAEQRRGRAGRVQAGVCYRLWTEASEASRPKKMMPEILDADLAALVLTSAAWGALRREDLPWMTPPPASAWDQACGLLKLLGALDARGNLTDRGKRMAKLPLHPRLANMMLDLTGAAREVAATLAAILEEGSKTRESDIRKIYDEVREMPNRPYSSRVLRLAERFEHIHVLRAPCAQAEKGRAGEDACTTEVSEGALLARAYPDRIGKNRGNGSFQMVCGRGAFVEASDMLAKAPYLVACELDDRAGDAKLFVGCPIGEDEIEELFGDQVVEAPYCAWDRGNDRVKNVVRRRLGAMTLREVTRTARETADADASALQVAAMVEGIRTKGVANMPCWTKESLQLRARVAFLHRHVEGWSEPTDELLLAALPGFLGGMTKWKDLEKLDLFAVFDFLLREAGHDRRELDRLAPTRMEVPSGSNRAIHYEGEEPTVEVRLQECFGLMATPKVAGGRVPIVMTLLSPAQRPVQITKDLEGFWKGAYQLVRKDLRGRYPKHYWPEDPFTAVATCRVRPRT